MPVWSFTSGNGPKCRQIANKGDQKTTVSGARRQQGQSSPVQSSGWQIIKSSLRDQNPRLCHTWVEIQTHISWDRRIPQFHMSVKLSSNSKCLWWVSNNKEYTSTNPEALPRKNCFKKHKQGKFPQYIS